MPSPEPVLDDALDIQHDPFPAGDEEKPRRIPHLGHALLFLSLTITIFLLSWLLFAGILHGRVQPGTNAESLASLALEGLLVPVSSPVAAILPRRH